MKAKHFLLMAFFLILLSSCTGESSAAPPATASPENSADVVPTNEPTLATTATDLPTDVPLEPSPEPTEAPGDGPFRDDFGGELDPSWTWVNEDPSRWQITTDGRLEIIAADPPMAAETTDIPQVNLLTRAIPRGVDISVTTYVLTNPDENFEQAALYLFEDGDSYVLVDLGFCGFCGGKGIYLEAYSDGQSLLEGLQFFPIPADTQAVWLRLEYSPENDALVALVAVEEGDWQMVGQVMRNLPAFAMVGLGAANLPGPEANLEEDLAVQFDFLEIVVFE